VLPRCYLDSSASIGIFCVTGNKAQLFDNIKQLAQPMALGLTDQEASIIFHRMGETEFWKEIVVWDTLRKRIIAVDKLIVRGYSMRMKSDNTTLYREAMYLCLDVGLTTECLGSF
jgi:hypothetical protein